MTEKSRRGLETKHDTRTAFFGHCKGTTDLARLERLEPFVLLSLVTVLGEDLCVRMSGKYTSMGLGLQTKVTRNDPPMLPVSGAEQFYKSESTKASSAGEHPSEREYQGLIRLTVA